MINAKKMRRLLLKIRYRLVCVTGRNHSKWLRKHKLFDMLGESVLYQTHNLPNDPNLIRIHNNVRIAANVVFYEHDVINMVFSKLSKTKMNTNKNPIEIFDNVFIGGSAIVVGPCRIGPNAIVAAGSVVVKDVAPGTIVGGNPAKVIGNFEDLMKKRLESAKIYADLSNEDYIELLWKNFDKKTL